MKLQFAETCAVLSHSVVSNSLRPARLLCPWGFSRQVYWNGLPCPSPGDLPNPGIEPGSPALQVGSFLAELPEMWMDLKTIVQSEVNQKNKYQMLMHACVT